jgi:hypothetical protein
MVELMTVPASDSPHPGRPDPADAFHRVVSSWRAHVEGRARGARGSGPELAASADARLRAVLALGTDEMRFVWACAASAVDPTLYPHLIEVAGVDGRRGLSVAAFAALGGVAPDAAVGLARWLAARPTIVRLGLLVEVGDGAGLTAMATPYRPSPRLLAHLAGADGGGDEELARVEVPAGLRVCAAQAEAVDTLRRALAAPAPRPLVVVAGPAGVGKRTAVAVASSRPVVALALDEVEPAAATAAVQALLAEAALADAVAVLANVDALDPGAAGWRAISRLVAGSGVDCVVTTRDPALDLDLGGAVVRVTLPLPVAATRRALWDDALVGAPRTADAEGALADVAQRYRLGPGGVRRAAAAARALASGGAVGAGHVRAGVRGSVAERFGGLAEPLEVTDRWEELIASDDTVAQLRALVGRARHARRVYDEWGFPRSTARGGGVAALFSGPPGTGKTLCAGLLARELDRDLYRVDLSRIVSKWVGETEKQLARVFEAAEAGHALLLFDEADALFAKRTEVKSSSDRYANLEVNYLLQRIEAFGGVVVLTTNLEGSIDPALMRRLAAHVVFWPPDHDERVRLWRRFLAAGAPLGGDVDVGELADELAGKFADMSGAHIRNAVLAAAFAAAAGEGVITADELRRAARAEYRAMGRVLRGQD